MLKPLSLVIIIISLVSCADENQHFCARYQYVYSQLDDPELPSYETLKFQLIKKIAEDKAGSDHEQFMLFVLEDYQLGIKNSNQSSKSYCLDNKRWLHYHGNK